MRLIRIFLKKHAHILYEVKLMNKVLRVSSELILIRTHYFVIIQLTYP